MATARRACSPSARRCPSPRGGRRRYRSMPRADIAAASKRSDSGPVRIAFVDAEERAALRLFLRALRRLDTAPDWQVTIVSARGPSSSTPLRADLRKRVQFVSSGEAEALAS